MAHCLTTLKSYIKDKYIYKSQQSNFSCIYTDGLTYSTQNIIIIVNKAIIPYLTLINVLNKEEH